MMEPLQRLTAEVAREQDEALERDVPLRELRARVLNGLPIGRPKPRHGRWLLTGLAGAVALASVLFVVRQSGGDAPSLTYRVGDAPSSNEVGRLLTTGPDVAMDLRFSEGSSVVLQPNTHLRVTALAGEGAQVRLERGRAALTVQHRQATTHWTVEAGPFVVQVVGTSFDVSWDPKAGAFELRMHDGSVGLSGPVVGERQVRGGDVVKVSLVDAGGQVTMGGTRAQQEPAPPQVQDAPPKASPKEARPLAVRAPEDFVLLARQGRYADAVAAARAVGWERTLQNAPAEALIALGDAARLSGDLGGAEEIYLAVRKRFAGTRHAANAAFVLGRLEFDQKRSPATAATWFTQYLQEAPSGPVAAEATGRLMEAQLASGDRMSAQATARRYLVTYPTGAHADLARSLVEPSR